MPLKKAVALDRRMDLASLFCMIARHGPAVALAVIAMVSVLGVFVIYRRGKRRKATAAAADRDSKSPGVERSVIRPDQEPSPEESHSFVESTDASESSSDVKEDLIQRPFEIRQRRAVATEKGPTPFSSWKNDFQIPANKRTTSDDTEEMAAVQGSNNITGMFAEQASGNLQSDAYEVEDAAKFYQSATDDTSNGLIEEVVKAEHQENENVATDKDVFGKTGQEVEKCASNSPVCFDQTPHMSENVDDDRPQSELAPEPNSVVSKLEEPVVHIKDVPVSCIRYGKEEEFEEENRHPHSNYSSNVHLSPEETKNNESEEAKKEDENYQMAAQQTGTQSSISEQEMSVPSSQQDQSDHMTDKVSPHHDDEQVNEEVIAKDHLKAFRDVTFDTHSPQVEQERETEQKEGLAGHQEDVVPPVTTDARPQFSGILDLPDLTRDSQQPQSEVKEDEIAPPLSKNIEANILSPHLLCLKKDQGTTGAAPLAENITTPPLCQIHSLSFRPSEFRDNDKDSMSSPGTGEESGISSLTVSPDLQDVGNELDVTVENAVLPVLDSEPQSEEKVEAQNILLTDDAAVSVNEDTAGMVSGPYPSHLSQQPHSESTDGAKYESFAASEDTLGRDTEDKYHRALDQLAVQSSASVASEKKTQADIKDVLPVVKITDNKEGVSVEKKAEKEKNYEKTEISIMEATMDNNEWISDGNYPVLPWMNVSLPSSAQEDTKNNQLPTGECQPSSGIDTDGTPRIQVSQTSTRSVDENNKKVLAVLPMPQNVSVTFRIHYLTYSPNQMVAVTGNQQELGNWKEFILLESAEDGYWAAVVSLPAESHVEWKFVVVDKGKVCRWEECSNRHLDTGYGEDLTVHKWWGFL
uniref:Starch-binding domain-containing protein 1 n=1 Tax=Monopterus albus TaxID=43700 RepID=A0A3Q3QBG4_MONAL|nr:starch-binding domain-containing protein 1 [Monopterus albus]XP_020456787.1 starch-binding domain-containing protein 1 [Monopterus albus]